jgi:hypothetical protein
MSTTMFTNVEEETVALVSSSRTTSSGSSGRLRMARMLSGASVAARHRSSLR